MKKEESILLDSILNELTKSKNKDMIGFIDCKSLKIESLNNEKIIKLIYQIRKEQIKLPDRLIMGSNSALRINKPHINEFLLCGGFEELYKKRRKKKRIECLKLILTIIILLLSIYTAFF